MGFQGEDLNGIPSSFATVSAVDTSGVQLVFDGESQSSGKVYACNAGMTYKVGDRVKVTKDGGSYVVDYVVGDPGSRTPEGGGGATSVNRLVNGTYIASLLTSGHFAPTGSGAVSLGSSSYPWAGLYTTGNISLGNSSSKLGFFGTDPIAKITLSTSSNNQGFTTVTRNNYTTTGVYVINNIVGILKKYGLIG